jgi:hypothetical protein
LRRFLSKTILLEIRIDPEKLPPFVRLPYFHLKGTDMQLLDATMAFALTLAAFGTVVTVIMEAIHRVMRIRKGNLILVLQHLNKELPKGLFSDIQPPHRWDFIANVLNNTTRVKDKLPHSSTVTTPSGEKTIPTVFWAGNKIKGFETWGDSLEKAWNDAIDSLGHWNGTRGIYDKVSLEHVLRKFVEIDEVREKISQGRNAAKVEINRLARKYEEFSSSSAADFKRRAQLWSVVIGVLLALAANINGVRIFEAYMVSDELTARVIGQFETLEKEANQAQDSFQKAIEEKGGKGSGNFDSQIQDKRKTLSSLYRSVALADTGQETTEPATPDMKIKALEEEIDALVEKRYASSQAGRAQQSVDDAVQKLASLAESGVPMGMKYFPHCVIYKWLSGEKRMSCLEREPESDSNHLTWFIAWISWVVATVLTGMLIGLGAPFWFDVAKRLAAVRAMFGGIRSTEERLRGRDAEGDPKQRKELVENIVEDAMAERVL